MVLPSGESVGHETPPDLDKPNNHPMHLQKIPYSSLNARQKETYNFQKVAGALADYGFACIKLNDDWQGADFIAQHIDGNSYLKVQLKGRLTFDKKYVGKDLWICFPYQSHFYLFNHDKMLDSMLQRYTNTMAVSRSWTEHGMYSWNSLSKEVLGMLEEWRL